MDKIKCNDLAVAFSEEQMKVLKERILKEEKGKAIYHDARETVSEIKNKLKQAGIKKLR